MATSRILRLPAVLDRTGLSRSGVYDLASRGEFPRPVRLGLRAVGWREADVEDWIAERPDVPTADDRTGRT